MDHSIHILMTGAGAPGAPGIIHCLKQDQRIKLTVADADPDATGRHLADDFLTIPKAGDPRFIQQLLDICIEKKIGMIMPLVTRELLPLSKNMELFGQNGIRILVSPAKTIETVNNKSQCYSFLKSAGIEMPQFHIVRNMEEFIHAAFELGHPQRSFVFKPSVSNGSRGVRIVSDSLDESDMLFNQKPYHLHITYAHALHILASKPFPELLVAEYLPGMEYSVDCIAAQGQPLVVVPRSRNKMVNGISVKGEFIDHKAIIAYCEKIIRATGLHGNIGIQVKMTDDEKPLLLEINPRVQGTVVAALGAGINLPLLAVMQESGSPVKIPDIHWGTRFSRYWTEVFY